jgi:hypothetical protein
MKLIKLDIDRFVVVDDAEIPYVKDGGTNGHFLCFDELRYGWPEAYVKNVANCKSCRRITHSTHPIEKLVISGTYSGPTWKEVRLIDLSYIKQLIGQVNIRAKAAEFYSHKTKVGYDIFSAMSLTDGFVLGYHKSLEDNKDKQYTFKDIQEAFEAGRYEDRFKLGELENKYSIAQWEVEFDEEGKLKLVE